MACLTEIGGNMISGDYYEISDARLVKICEHLTSSRMVENPKRIQYGGTEQEQKKKKKRRFKE